MLSALDSVREQIKNYWGNLEKSNKRNIIFLSILFLLTIIIAFVFLTKKDYVVLYSGLTDIEAAEVYSKLEEVNAQPKISGTSTILVPKNREAELRMQMTLDGYPKSGFNYDFLEGGSFGQTDDEIQKRWIIQLQERLGESIRSLEGVEHAVVTIAMPKSDSFVLKENEIPVTASVIIFPRIGYEITGQQAKSIEQLMSTSVPGLNEENISIIDNKMAILNVDEATDSQMVADQFIMQQQLEDKIKKEIAGLLEPVFGYGRIKSAVSVKLNFDKKVKESVTFEPVSDDSGIIVSQELLKEKVNSDSLGGIPGEVNNTTQYPELEDREGYSSQKDQKTINYEVNEIKEMIEEEKGKLDYLSIAVIIDNEDLEQQTIDDVRDLVAMAIGTDLDRVAVQNFKFNTDLQQDLIDALNDQPEDKLLSLTMLILIIAVLLIIVISVAFISRNRRLKAQKEMEEFIPEMEPGTESEVLFTIEPGEDSAIKKQLNKFAEDQPEEIAQLLRNWISEE